MTTGITIALTRWTFVGKIMSLLGKGPVKKIIAIQVGIDTFELSCWRRLLRVP